MKTNTTTKLILAALGAAAVAVLGVASLKSDLLPNAGVIVSYIAAVAILGIAAFDNRSARRLS